MAKKGLLQRLSEGVVIGDGGYNIIMEKRGYVRIGLWTPDANVEHPEAVTQLHREFLRAGSDVLQGYTFNANDRKLARRKSSYSGAECNRAAMEIVRKVAAEGDALTAASLNREGLEMGKTEAQENFRRQAKIFIEGEIDFIICEFFDDVEEVEWAIEVCKEFDKPIVATMCIGPMGDMRDVSAGECAVRMSRAGADVVGVNCYFDPDTSLETLALMKEGLIRAGLLEKPTYLMAQPIGWHCPDATTKCGYEALPEYPTALEPRTYTRWEMHAFARKAFELGVRYIGGCCGTEPHHIRAISEELQPERGGKVSEGSKKHDLWGAGLKWSSKTCHLARTSKDYWSNLVPSTGRPNSSALSKPDQ